MDASWLPTFACLTDAAPHARLLSNGRSSVLLTSAGTGVSSWGDLQLTGWDGDRVVDDSGWFFYLRDLDDGAVWSAGLRPIALPADAYDASSSPGVVTLKRTTAEIESTLSICVDPDADAEVRRLTLVNRSSRRRRIEVTSFCEVVLNSPGAHAGHPAFSKLFVETELIAAQGVLLARRRPRSHGEGAPSMAMQLTGPGALEHESDRARFAGRNRSPAAPLALDPSRRLEGGIGSVLDPVFALRRVAVLEPGAAVTLHGVLAAGADRDAALAAITKAGADAALAGVVDRAAARARDTIKALGIDAARAEAYQELAGAIRYGHPALRADAATVQRARGAMNDIWQFALGGAPFAVAVADDAGAAAHVAELIAAQAYWLRLGTRIDLMILCGAATADATIDALAHRQPQGATLAVRRRQALPAATVDVVLAAAGFVCIGSWPTLGGRRSVGAAPAASSEVRKGQRGAETPAPAKTAEPLRFDNGVGGFSADGREYVIHVDGERRPPLAWTNVIANEHFGFLVSESGAAFTWSRNSHEHRLTPWQNDPLRDLHSEALYVRDEATGDLWSPQPGPAPAEGAYEVRHGFGTSTWRHRSHELDQEVIAFVPPRDPVRIVRLRLTNRAAGARRLSICSYQQLVIGVTPADSSRFVVTEHDSGAGMLLARNWVNGELNDGATFASAVCETGRTGISHSGDRAAFLGRHGSVAAPVALATAGGLDGRTGAGLDPCFALQLAVEVPAGETIECAFLFGEAADHDAAAAIVARYRRLTAVDAALAETRAFWAGSLGAVQIETPEPALDLMVNGWLLYQAMSCRIWGRSALYQSGGAYGFRDQLQDSAALVYAHPELTRAQILLHAAHQFVEGDVLHWWHPPASRGTRTRFSDDLLWLPYIAGFYAHTTGDWAIFDESADFMTAPALAPGQDENYLLPSPAKAPASVFEHCCRAIDRSLTRGAHGLPLMGTGDWNDGMNRVGREGRGESVFVAFFLYDVLGGFIPLCERRGEHERAQRYSAYREALGAALEDTGWDGEWYRRAYFDDGAPLGSAQNDECRIDTLAQSWAVISAAAPPARAAQAMQAVDKLLVDRQAGFIKLLTPPFDRGAHDPGYIKGYVPGIRENGGQYTHAAMWTVRAFAEVGWRDRAAAYLAMISPVSHGGSAERLATYQVEPYVVVADIYSVEPHVGRGGWTWYTGSAAWMYRVAVESILGVTIAGGTQLLVRPCIPDEWPGFQVRLRLPGKQTVYEIAVDNPQRHSETVVSATLDGVAAAVKDGAATIALADDGGRHEVRVVLGRRG